MAGVFTPRHLRKRGNNKGAAKDLQKQQMFRRAALWSKRFIHQSASALESPRLAAEYQVYSEAARKGALRRTASK